MANIERIRVALTGFQGGPGVCTHYATDAGALLADLHTFWTGMSASMPNDVQIQIEGEGDIVNDATGILVGQWNDTAPSSIGGSDAGKYPAPSGVAINWISDGVPWGYVVKGRTYCVPLGGAAYDTDGSIEGSARTAFQGYAAALVGAGAGNFKVWNRPRAAKAADGSRPAITSRAGTSWDVVSYQVPDKACILTSRRD